jgi:hypothetical protein
MTIIAAPAILSEPSTLSVALMANTQSGGRSPLDGTEQTLRQPGERWMASLGFEGLTQDEWRPLMAFISRLGGRAGRFTWSPPLPRRATGIAGRTNHVWNSIFAGAAIGNPGTDWRIVGGSPGATVAVSATGTDGGGFEWIELTLSGLTAGGTLAGQLEHIQVPFAPPGSVWTASATLQIMGGNYAPITELRMGIKEFSGADIVESSFGTGTTGPLAAGPVRRSATRTMGPTATSCRLAVDVRVAASTSYSLVLRIHSPMLERATPAGIYVPTSIAPRTVLAGPFADGGPQSGASLALRGFLALEQAFQPGDLLGYVDAGGRPRLHQVTDFVQAAEAGTCTVPIAPPLRGPVADGTAFVIDNPMAVWRLSSDRNATDIARGLIGGGTIEIEEALV